MKIKTLTMAMASLLVLSCQQEELSIPVADDSTDYGVRLVEIVDGTQVVETTADTRSAEGKELALQFPSESVYQAFLEQLKSMSHQERISFIQSYGLTSIQEIAEIANKELDEIWENVSDADLMDAYKSYKEKYDGILISNMYNSRDLSLYVPDGDELSTYVLTPSKHIVVGNQIRDIKLKNDMGQSDITLFGDVVVKPDGTTNFYGYQNITDGRKTTVSVTVMSSSGIKFHVGYQKKKAFWWKRDDRITYMKFSGDTFCPTFKLDNGLLSTSKYNRVDVYTYSKNGKIDSYIGAVEPGKVSLKGNIKVWTDLTYESTTKTYTSAVVDEFVKTKIVLQDVKDEKAYQGDFDLALFRD